MDKLGIALIGLDHWYSAFDLARHIARSERLKLVSVSHDDAARAAKFAADFGADFHTTDDRAAFERPGVDIVVLLHSVERNAALCKAAAALGKHIVSVKPMAMTLSDADDVVRAVRAANVHFFPLDASWRMSAERERQKRWVGEGRIGQVVRMSHSMNSMIPQEWIDGPRTGGWWVDPARVPGGGWLDHAIYAIDVARWTMNSRPVSVSGRVANVRHASLKMEDYGVATFAFDNGTTVVIEDTWTAEDGHFYMRNEIVGSGGVLLEDGGSMGGRLALRGNFGHTGWSIIEPLRGQSTNAVEHLAQVALGEVAPLATVEDGRDNLRYCLAFYQAAREGKTVQL